jgi:N-acetylglucosaminyl-diphospho-decaprenol L-rhamnosyltransferase
MPNYIKDFSPGVANGLVELDITIIVVSYNTRAMTLDCIRSVFEHTHSRYELIVIDNASTDGSAEAIKAEYPTLRLIASPINLGFARANNVAAEEAQGRRILLLNPDTLVLDSAIDRLHQFAVENPACRIWGGRTIFADGTLNSQSCWRKMTLWSVFCTLVGLNRIRGSSIFYYEGYGGWARDTVRHVDIVTGCFFLIDRDLWRQLEGFDPVFFMYGEEADLCLRASQLGARPTVTPAATIVHYGGASETNGVHQRIKLLAGKITLLKRHWSSTRFRIGRLAHVFLPLTRSIALGVAGFVLRKSELRRAGRDWHLVWQARKQWANGWSNSDKPGMGLSHPPDSQLQSKNIVLPEQPQPAKTKRGFFLQELVVVVYHNVADKQHALTKHLDVNTSLDHFDKHVRYFSKNFDFISGSDLVAGVLPRKAILVTFDDAYRSVLDVAAPILNGVCAPSVFFVTAGMLVGSYLPVDNVLSYAVHELGWERMLTTIQLENTSARTVSELLLFTISAMKPAQVRAIKAKLLTTMSTTEHELQDESGLFIGNSDLTNLSASRMDVGNHSMHHSFFRTLSDEELQTEVCESRALLQRLSAQPVSYLSIPYGNRQDATFRALKATRECGHKATFLVHAKSNRFRIGHDIYYRTSVGEAATSQLPFILSAAPLIRSIKSFGG